MKHFLHIIALLLLTLTATAQAPDRMTYQAVVRSAANTLVTNAPVGVRTSILQGSPNGPAVYIETQTPTTNANGLATMQIGAGTAVTGSMASVDWSQGPYFIKTETDPTGGTNYTVTGTSELLSVPYALYAKTSGSTSPLYIGKIHGGGVIFHLWRDSTGVEHGLVVSMNNAAPAAQWSNVTQVIGGTAQSTFDGLANSTAITTQPGHVNSAAKLCLDLVENGYSDWYLPSIDELANLYRSRFEVNKILSVTPGAFILPVWADYWSSTESPMQYGWFFSFYNGSASFTDKTNPHSVRAVRRF